MKIQHVGKMFKVNQYGLCKEQMLSKPQGVGYTFLISFISRFFFSIILKFGGILPVISLVDS